MRRMKSLLIASVFALGAAPAFAGQDSTVHGSVETSPPELPSDESLGREDVMPEGSDELALAEGDVIYIYPMEVTEYYLIIPSESSEMSG
jgi:hypothetical protein